LIPPTHDKLSNILIRNWQKWVSICP